MDEFSFAKLFGDLYLVIYPEQNRVISLTNSTQEAYDTFSEHMRLGEKIELKTYTKSIVILNPHNDNTTYKLIMHTGVCVLEWDSDGNILPISTTPTNA